MIHSTWPQLAFKSHSRRTILLLVTLLYIVLWIGGVTRHFLDGGIAPEQNWIASLFLSLAGIIVLLSADSASDRRMLISLAIFGFTIEILGVRTGFPFGAYNYTEVLNPRLFGVPLVMAFAWMTLVAFIKQALLALRLSFWTEGFVGALWMTAIDLIIDPVAANQLGYWRWAKSGAYYGIPLTNFLGWFAMSLLTFYLFRWRLQPNRWTQFVGTSITLFFTLLALAHHLYLAALIGCGVCLILFLIVGLSRKLYAF